MKKIYNFGYEMSLSTSKQYPKCYKYKYVWKDIIHGKYSSITSQFGVIDFLE